MRSAALLTCLLLIPTLALAKKAPPKVAKPATAEKAAAPAPAAPVAAPAPAPAPVKPAVPEGRHVKLVVNKEGLFEPTEIPAKVGEQLVLDVTRLTNDTCATEIIVREQGINVPLPFREEVHVGLKAGKSGTIRFACAMGHVAGAIVVTD